MILEKKSMKVQLSPKALANIDRYIAHYRRYFFELYSDTGLGESEKIIKESYNKEAKMRKGEILKLIEIHFTPGIILGRTLIDSLILPWRSKVVFVTWEELENGIRRIIDLEIR